MQNSALSSAQTGFNTINLSNELLLARGGTGKPSLSSIQSQYQVSEDRMIRWEPKLAGFIPSFGLAGNRTMTATEGQMLDRLTRDQGILGLQRFSNLVNESFATANQRVPTSGPIPAAVEAEIKKLPADMQRAARDQWPTGDGHNDAFRHAYWNARMTSEFGESWANQYATAHEAVTTQINNSSVREAMDLYNNEVGRQIARDNPNASPAELADKVRQALDDGKLLVVNQRGQLAWSNEVAVGHHGRASAGSAPGAIAVPEGNAYADQP
jgi:hypothetical protein